MRRSKAPTLQDVADGAGVSIMMASVVINGAQSSTRVAPDTRIRILDVAEKLRYRRNAVARGLSRQRMDAIGVTAVSYPGEINLYFLELLNGILEGAADHHQNTTVFSISSWRADSQKLPGYCDGRVDGMILIAPDISAPETLSHHTPFVTIHGNELHPQIHNLDVDNEGGAYDVTRYLVAQGHRRIAHFPGSLDVLGARQRLAGYRRALAESGFPSDCEIVIEGNYSAWSGRWRAEEMLKSGPKHALPTAIFCGSDAIAFGCMEVFAAAGIDIPGYLSIVGFDDTLTARMTRPPLTTVRQPFREMGRCAVEKVLALIDGYPVRPPLHGSEGDEAAPACLEPRIQTYPAELIVRESAGPPRT
jgi:LacI family transcriptional regulator